MTAAPIVYLHGFRSSPSSQKAGILRARLAAAGAGDRFLCPQLPASPREAVTLVEALVAAHGGDWRNTVLIGASLGGLYARWLAQRHGCRAVLLNPVVALPADLSAYLGRHAPWYGGEEIVVTPQHLDELRALEIPAPSSTPGRYYLVVTRGDALLDYRLALNAVPAAQTVVADGDHGISDFAAHVDGVLQFCGVAATAR